MIFISGRRCRGAALAFCLATAAAPADAAVFTVTTLADTGAGSLRDAVDQANRTAGDDSIVFQGGLTGTITFGSPIDVTQALQINALGTGITLSGNDTVRLFNIYLPVGVPDAYNVGMTGLKFTHGHADAEGGAILVGDVSLYVTDSEFANNTSASRGGALYAFPTGKTTSLNLSRCSFHDNTATVDGGALGAQDISAVNLTDITVRNNAAAKAGAGAYFRSDNLVFSRVRFDANHGGTAPLTGNGFGGGGVEVQGLTANATLSISDSRFTGNSSQHGWGGGLSLVDTAATLVRTELSGNSAGDSGGGIEAQDTALTLDATTVAENTAGGNGGGVSSDFTGTLTITDGTLVANTSGGSGGGVYTGVGITVAHGTIVGNHADSGSGGGVNRSAGTTNLGHAIVANNTALSGADLAGSFTANWCLVKSAAGATLAGSNNVTNGTDPQLGVLAVNGGPTRTLLPALGSPIINAGNPAFAGPPALDQRGLPRSAGGRTDLGAVEWQSPEDVIFRTNHGG